MCNYEIVALIRRQREQATAESDQPQEAKDTVTTQVCGEALRPDAGVRLERDRCLSIQHDQYLIGSISYA